MNKKAVFKELLDKFETDEMRLYCEDMIENIPDYIFTMPSSTTGKWHNATQCQPHGQIYHIIMFGQIANYRLGLKYNKEKKFPNPRVRDAIRCTAIFHDAWKCNDGKTTFAVHEHPLIAAEWVLNMKVEHDIDEEMKIFISKLCASHSGEWTTAKRGSKVILPEPQTEAEIFVHECDYLASRADIDMQPSDYLKSVFREENVVLHSLDDYVLNFGRHKGEKLIDVFKTDHSYCIWLKENSYQKEIVDMIKKIEANQEDEI